MFGTSLYELFSNRMFNSNMQNTYNIATFNQAYRSTVASQREKSSSVRRKIECDHVKVRLRDDTGRIPSDIERCE